MSTLAPYDGVLLLSFGGPERPEDVMPFLRHVTGGRGVPDARLAEVAHHYEMRGGVSPINAENRRLMAALQAELTRRGEAVPVLWGNRHAEPFTIDALREAADRGLKRLVAVITSAYPSYSGCRQYREDLAESVAELSTSAGASDLVIDKVRAYADHPGFLAAATDRTVAAVRELVDRHDPARPHLVFVTHSIPDAMAHSSGPTGEDYLVRHQEVAEVVMAAVRESIDRSIDWSLVYCSRSGPPAQPWLEPDIGDHLADLAESGVDAVAVSPIGFVADHMEVVHDLDTEAADIARELGLPFVRVPTVQHDPHFVTGLVDLLEERAAQARGDVVRGASATRSGPLPAVCVPGCCPNLRGERPALCGRDAHPHLDSEENS